MIFGAVAWSAAWIAIYLPWEFTVEYYMLPVALGASVIGGSILASAMDKLRSGHGRRLTWFALALALPLWLATLPNNLSNARQQIAVDEANARMLDFLVERATRGASVIVNIQSPNEYIYETQAYLQAISGLPEVTVEAFDPDQGLPQGRDTTVLVVSPQVLNQPLLAVRMGVVEETQHGWNQSLEAALGSSAEPIFQTESKFHLSIVDLPRALCPLLPGRGYCRAEPPFIDTRPFHYGWKVYLWEGMGGA